MRKNSYNYSHIVERFFHLDTKTFISKDLLLIERSRFNNEIIDSCTITRKVLNKLIRRKHVYIHTDGYYSVPFKKEKRYSWEPNPAIISNDGPAQARRRKEEKKNPWWKKRTYKDDEYWTIKEKLGELANFDGPVNFIQYFRKPTKPKYKRDKKWKKEML